MPAALLVMQRKVPIRLTWMMRSKLSSGYSLISPRLLVARTVFTEPPTPAQLTRMRSWPMAARDFANAASTSGVEVTLTWQNTPPISAASALAQIRVEIEERDLDPMRRQHPGGRRAEAGGAAGDDGGDR